MDDFKSIKFMDSEKSNKINKVMFTHFFYYMKNQTFTLQKMNLDGIKSANQTISLPR